jgi:hypothetical protein
VIWPPKVKVYVPMKLNPYKADRLQLLVAQLALTQYWPGMGAPTQVDDASGKRVVSALVAQVVAEPTGGHWANAEPGGLGTLVCTMT